MSIAHKHANLMMQYAQDAAETDRPWERWEVRIAANVQPNAVFEMLHSHPTWDTSNEYRRKRQIIKVGKWEFPKPISKAPLDGIKYYLIKTGDRGFKVDTCAWVNDRLDNIRLESGRVHLTYEDAQTHANVLNVICKGDA